jgi:hypothetical protein
MAAAIEAAAAAAVIDWTLSVISLDEREIS